MTRRAWFVFIIVAVLWGVPYFFIKIALHDVSPAVVGFTRVAVGGLVTLPLALRSGALPRLRSRLWPLVVVAATEATFPLWFIPIGERFISSSLTAILISSDPLFIALLAIWLDRTERVTGWRLVGLVVGLLGVGLLVGLDLRAGNALLGGGMVLFSAVLYAIGALAIKRWFTDVPAVAVSSIALLMGAVVLAVPAALSWPHTVPHLSTLGSLAVLGIGCTGMGFFSFFALVSMIGAGRASVVTYVSPAVALLLGVAVRGETFTVSTAAGLVLILAGSWLATRPGDRDALVDDREQVAARQA